jgi:hypothetical protein
VNQAAGVPNEFSAFCHIQVFKHCFEPSDVFDSILVSFGLSSISDEVSSLMLAVQVGFGLIALRTIFRSYGIA